MSHRQELRVAESAVREACDMLGESGHGYRHVYGSEHSNPVAGAEALVDDAVRTVVGDTFPDDPFNETGADRFWALKPISGLRNFASGFPYYGVSLALYEDGEVQVGVVGSPGPALGSVWSARRGAGAEVDGKRVSVAESSVVEEALVATPLSGGFRNRVTGCPALDLAQVASGGLDGFVMDLRFRDVAAGSLLVEEAGGDVFSESGYTVACAPGLSSYLEEFL